ncbi:MAG: hypothetical protein M9924_15095 [Rhizobiaceae bacterium]|nr:hypothetical protein [Rhizobiaceae bacterium]
MAANSNVGGDVGLIQPYYPDMPGGNMNTLTMVFLASAAICFSGWLFLRLRTVRKPVLQGDEPPEIETNFRWTNPGRVSYESDRYGWNVPIREERPGINVKVERERREADFTRESVEPFADADIEDSDYLEVPSFLRPKRDDTARRRDAPPAARPSQVVVHVEHIRALREVTQKPIKAEKPMPAPVPMAAPAQKTAEPVQATPAAAAQPKTSNKSAPVVADHPLGRIYFDPPTKMTEGEVTDMFVLIVSPTHIGTVRFADVTSSKRSPQTAEVAAPGLMFAKVYADPMALQVIALGNDPVKIDSALGYGQWQWRLRALQPGNHKITVRVSHARAIPGGGGLYAEDVVALNRDIIISVSKSRVARAWLLSAAGVLVGAAASQMVEGATPLVRNEAYGLLGWELPVDEATEPAAPLPVDPKPTNAH